MRKDFEVCWFLGGIGGSFSDVEAHPRKEENLFESVPQASVRRDSKEAVNIQEFMKKVLKRQGSVSNHAIGVSGKPDWIC